MPFYLLYHLKVLKIPICTISGFWSGYYLDHLLCLFSLNLLGLQCPLVELEKNYLTSLRFFYCLQNIVWRKNFCLSKWWRYMIMIWFELLFIILFCFWILFFAKAFVQFIFVSYRIGKSRSDPWFSFISRFWIFDSFIWRWCLFRSLFTILRKWTWSSFELEVRPKPFQWTLKRSA